MPGKSTISKLEEQLLSDRQVLEELRNRLRRVKKSERDQVRYQEQRLVSAIELKESHLEHVRSIEQPTQSADGGTTRLATVRKVEENCSCYWCHRKAGDGGVAVYVLRYSHHMRQHLICDECCYTILGRMLTEEFRSG